MTETVELALYQRFLPGETLDDGSHWYRVARRGSVQISETRSINYAIAKLKKRIASIKKNENTDGTEFKITRIRKIVIREDLEYIS